MVENKPFPSSSSLSLAPSSSQLAVRPSKPEADRAFFAPGVRAIRTMIAVLLILVLVAGCSAKADDSPSALMVKTQDIALAYQAHGDTAQAQADLAQLGVANPEQWLLLTTETAISGSDGQLSAGGTVALVKLAHDLGLRSTAVDDFARQNNLIPEQVSTQAQPQAQAQAQAETSAAAPVAAAPVVAVAHRYPRGGRPDAGADRHPSPSLNLAQGRAPNHHECAGRSGHGLCRGGQHSGRKQCAHHCQKS